jgi:2'-5' RNA ligase
VIKIPTPPSLIPGYTTCEYRIIIQPHEDLCNKINLIKKLFAEAFQLPVVNYSKPDITVVRFTQYEMMEERIIHRIKNIVTTIAAFKVELEDFGSFPSHSIFINVATKTSIIALVKELRSIQKLLKLNEEHKPHFITEPFITIAAKLLPWQYEKGWLEYSNTPFTAMFMAEDILLLKRNTGEKKYQTIQRFQLQPYLGSPIVKNKVKQLSFF